MYFYSLTSSLFYRNRIFLRKVGNLDVSRLDRIRKFLRKFYGKSMFSLVIFKEKKCFPDKKVMRTENFLISSHMTHQGYTLSVKINDFRKKKLLVPRSRPFIGNPRPHGPTPPRPRRPTAPRPLVRCASFNRQELSMSGTKD
jgi:hypothetical protein